MVTKRERRTTHPTHCHDVYGLSCADYDALLERAAGACELCRRPWSAENRVKPQVDHDHYALDGWTGVRGIVCAKCNAHMRRVDLGERPIDARTKRYLDRAAPNLIGEITGLAAAMHRYCPKAS